MELPRPTATRGSMGIPPQIHPDALRRQREEEAASKEEAASTKARARPELDESDDEGDVEAPVAAEKPKDDPWAKTGNPLENLRKIGVELTPEDFQHLIFRGAIEKTLPLAFNPVSKEDITVTLKTLTPTECDQLDECLAEECATLKVTGPGIEDRRVAWTMAFAMLGIGGGVFAKPVLKTHAGGAEVIDTKATAKLRREVIGGLYVETVNKACALYGALSSNLKLLLGDPKKAFFAGP